MKKIKLILPLVITASTAFPIASMTSCSNSADGEGTTGKSLKAYLDNHKLHIGNGENFSSFPQDDSRVIDFMSKNITKQAILNGIISGILVEEDITYWKISSYDLETVSIYEEETIVHMISKIDINDGIFSIKDTTTVNGVPSEYYPNFDIENASIGSVWQIYRGIRVSISDGSESKNLALRFADFNVTFHSN